DDWRSSEDAASPDDLDDLLVGVELLEEIGAGERRDRHVGRLRVGRAAKPVRAVAVDAAVALVEERALDRWALAGDHGRRRRSRRHGAQANCAKSWAPAATLALTDVAPPFGTVPTTVTVFVTVFVPPQPARGLASRRPHPRAAPSRATVQARATGASLTPVT